MSELKLSIILATDYYATIETVVECMRRQTIRESIEIVLVGRSKEDLAPALEHRDEFGGMQLVEHPVEDLAPARAAGVLAAKAPFIFIGETHSYPHANLAETTLAVFDTDDCSVVTPCVANGNPVSPLSSSGVILDYGTWFVGLPPGEIPRAPVYNAVYKKEILLELGDRLGQALGQADDLWVKLRDEGHKILFEPRARIDHVNVTMPWHWAQNRFFCGTMIAGIRSEKWSLGKKLVYMGGSPLIPFVLFRRIISGTSAGLQGERRPIGTAVGIFVGLTLRAVGEILGYAGLLKRRTSETMFRYEVHKLKYAAR